MANILDNQNQFSVSLTKDAKSTLGSSHVLEITIPQSLSWGKSFSDAMKRFIGEHGVISSNDGNVHQFRCIDPIAIARILEMVIKYADKPLQISQDNLKQIQADYTWINQHIKNNAAKRAEKLPNRFHLFSERKLESLGFSEHTNNEIAEDFIDDGSKVFVKKTEQLLDNSPHYTLEALTAELYRLFLGHDRAPKTTIGIRESDYQKISVQSQELPNWQSLESFIGVEYDKSKPSRFSPDFPKQMAWKNSPEPQNYNLTYPQNVIDSLIEKGFIEVLVYNMFLEETDGHFANIGISDGKVSRIDTGDSLASFKYYWQAEQKDKDSYERNRGCAHDQGFEIVASDLDENFLEPKFFNPFRWVNKNAFGYKKEHEAYNVTPDLVKKIKENPHYEVAKFQAFLKIVLTPDQDILHCLDQYVSSKKQNQLLKQHLLQRKERLKQELLNLPKFCNLLLNNELNLMTLLNDFEGYYDDEPAGTTMTAETKNAHLRLLFTNVQSLLQEAHTQQPNNNNYKITKEAIDRAEAKYFNFQTKPALPDFAWNRQDTFEPEDPTPGSAAILIY